MYGIEVVLSQNQCETFLLQTTYMNQEYYVLYEGCPKSLWPHVWRNI